MAGQVILGPAGKCHALGLLLYVPLCVGGSKGKASPRSSGIHIRQIPRAHVTTITYVPITIIDLLHFLLSIKSSVQVVLSMEESSLTDVPVSSD